jgi:crotonobetainyl-CoA:carnitine CoA-transferase CaiB-like acyl-CoA transferase
MGKVAAAEPRDRNQAPLMNPYLTADGRWFFFTGLETARHLPAVCRALDRPDLLDDPRFADARTIRRHRVEVIALLDEIVATRPLDEWAERFDAEGVFWAPAHSPAEVVTDPQVLANDGIVDIPLGSDGTTMRSVNTPITFADIPTNAPAPVPTLGQHTAEILTELASGDRPRRQQLGFGDLLDP